MIDRVTALILVNYITRCTRITPSSARSLRERLGGNEYHKNFMTQLLVQAIGLGLSLYHWYAYGLEPLTHGEFSLLSIFLSGFILRFWAYQHLGRYFTFEIGIQECHRLVKTGPYKYMAHPGYVGQFILLVSSLLFFNPPWYVASLVLAYIIHRFRHRIRNEEEMLLEHFGEEWTSFRANRIL